MYKEIEWIQFIEKRTGINKKGQSWWLPTDAGVINAHDLQMTDITTTPLVPKSVAAHSGESYFAQTGRFPEYEPLEITITGTVKDDVAADNLQSKLRALGGANNYYIRIADDLADIPGSIVGDPAETFDAYWGHIKSAQISGVRPTELEATIVLEVDPYLRRVQDTTIHPGAGTGTVGWGLLIGEELALGCTWLRLLPYKLGLPFGVPMVKWGRAGAYIENDVTQIYVPGKDEVPTYLIPHLDKSLKRLNFASQAIDEDIRIFLEFGRLTYASPAFI